MRRWGVFAVVLAVGGVPLIAGVPIETAAPPAHAAPDDAFFTSFEAGQPAPDWENTAEVGPDGKKRMAGVTGTPQIGIPGNVTDTVVEVKANGENPPSETAERVVDQSITSKWLVFEPTGWVAVRLKEPVKVVHYALTSANDAPGRDPRDWTLQGSQDGENWTTLDTRTGQDFPERFHTKDWRIDNDTAYAWYRLNITANHGENMVQLAELQLSNGDTTPPEQTDMRAYVGAGPVDGWTMKPTAGWTGTRALHFSGGQTSKERGYAYNKVLDVDIPVGTETELSYVLFPELTANDLDYPSTHAAVDLAFTDGTYLSELRASDHHGFRASPQGQGASKSLWPDQWNHKRIALGRVAKGKRVDRILVGYDADGGPSLFNGWVDDIRIGARADESPKSLADHVRTTRGTNSSGGFSRGNNLPATAVPHGFNFWAPMTNAGSMSWLYAYQADNNKDNLPALQAFTASHEPSPWMGDRQTFQVMPSSAAPTQDRAARAQPFRHANEVARPHYYGVRFESGLRAEVAPTDHAAMFRFGFTGDTSYVMFDNVNDNGGLTLDASSGVVTGHSDTRSGLSNGATRLYVYGEFDQPVAAASKPGDGPRPKVFGHVRFDTGERKEVTLRIATSLISVEQAKQNLSLEAPKGTAFEDLRRKAQRLWDSKLRVVEVEGASPDQLTTLYSNLYRLFLYPNSAHENVGTADKPVYKHAVQSSTTTAPEPRIADGKVYVNNGFWDTYRTAWSAYALFASRDAGELVDGFVQQYRDGGWISRWSSPGYANLMTGTSSDAAFADVFLKGIPGIDAVDTYDAALKNATVAPPGDDPDNTSVGRKGLETALFRRFTPTTVSEGVSWALEGYINDFGISNQAAKLAADRRIPAADRARYKEEAAYFRDRARNYVEMFDPKIDFFQGRAADGTWKSTPDEYDPLTWGHEHDYTETNGWNFAFHVPHDGRGLANLYGGRAELAKKLDSFFTIPETATRPGSYGGIIHEMREARDIRLGQWGFSNQVSHHIPWMYLYAGQPWKTQALVRDVLSRMYVGSEIGQGYAGDEDNGETSAWYLFSALGLYPLQVGSENYVIGSPLFTKATVHLGGGRELVVKAPRNSARNVYVQGLKVDGRPYGKTSIPHSRLAEGAVLEFDMGPRPSRWGSSAGAAPPSLTTDDRVPRPLRDATGPGLGTPSEGTEKLYDDTSGTSVALSDGAIEYRLKTARSVRYYTLTSASSDGPDPGAWVLKGSNDGRRWTTLDTRRSESFSWRKQTRPFKVDRAASFSRYRVEFTGTAPSLSEVELLW